MNATHQHGPAFILFRAEARRWDCEEYREPGASFLGKALTDLRKIFPDGEALRKPLDGIFQIAFLSEKLVGLHVFMHVADGFVCQGFQQGQGRRRALAFSRTESLKSLRSYWFGIAVRERRRDKSA